MVVVVMMVVVALELALAGLKIQNIDDLVIMSPGLFQVIQ